MKHPHLDRTAAPAVALAALATLALAGPAAHAQPQPEGPGFTFGVYSVGAFIPTDPELAVNAVYGLQTLRPDGSRISHLGCVPAVAGGTGCSTDGQPIVVDTWYKHPNLPTFAAAQAYAGFGVLKARSWRTEGSTGDSAPGDPLGTRSYFAQATAEWREELIYTGSAPTWVTMQFTLHATWNDLGRFGFTIGRDTIGAENVRVIDGTTYANCAGPIQCGSGNFGASIVPVPGNDAANTSGEVTLAINYRFLLGQPPIDPENPGPAAPFIFVAHLQTSSTAPGAEVDAFQTATLDRILIEPGVQIGFGSGHNWAVQVVPEPATYVLWALGLAGALAARRRASDPGTGPGRQRHW